MKLLLIVAFVIVAIWLWRSSRATGAATQTPVPPPVANPQDMVSCALCSVHVPVADAVAGHKGSYCCADHLHRAEP
jgi:uncharacterized protein